MLHIAEREALLLQGGRIIDRSLGRDEIANLAIVNGVIVDSPSPDSHVIDATDWIICPGFMDIHVHLREPGQTHKETIETGTAAAAAGGFTFVAAMPNTKPAIDSPDLVRTVLKRGQEANHCSVGPVAAITRGRAGKEITDFAALLEVGAVGFSDDGNGVEDDSVMGDAFKMAAATGAVLMQHCEYRSISAGGVMHLGEVSRKLGLPGLDPHSEEAMIERDIGLCRKTGGRYHVAHISTARGVELVRCAKAEGLAVTTEVAVHHLLLTEEACSDGDPNTKMHPPLRTRADVEACRQGLIDGTIDCVVTDHAPHTAEEKSVGFAYAPPGVVGLETAIGLTAKGLIDTGLADWPDVIGWFTTGPAGVLGRNPPRIEAGSGAELTLLAPKAGWTFDPGQSLSKARNTPFGGWKLVGRPVGTVRATRMTLHGDFQNRSG